MSYTIRPAKRENVWLLLGLAGGTGSGKTYSAMRLAKGLAGGKRFGVVDTENGRASHYADDFQFDVIDLAPPFRPERYSAAIQTFADKKYDVILVDSMTHEWDGDGGLLEWHDKESGGSEARNLAGWIKPKMAHRKFVTHLLQTRAHIILCFRAAERVEMIDDPEKPGKKKIVPKRSLTGLDGWVPISEKTLPFELTLSLLLIPDFPGFPHPIKLQQQHRSLVPLDQPISEQTGEALAAWARGAEDPAAAELPALITEALEIAQKLGKRGATETAITKDRQKHAHDLSAHAAFLRGLIERGSALLADKPDEPEEDPFADLPPAEPPTTEE